MSFTAVGLIFLSILVASFGMILGYRGLATRFGFVDKPNSRSSHTTPVPVGAGLVFLLTTLLGLGLIFYFQGMGLKPFLTISLGAFAYTVLGFVDDVKVLSAYLYRLFHIFHYAFSDRLKVFDPYRFETFVLPVWYNL